MKKLGLKAGDLILVAVIFLAAVILFILPFFSERSAYAEIVIAETNETKMISLEKDAEYSISSRGIDITVKVSGGEVFVLRSECRDGICSGTAPISRAGQSIVCAPAGVVIRVCGEEAAVDGVSR